MHMQMVPRAPPGVYTEFEDFQPHMEDRRLARVRTCSKFALQSRGHVLVTALAGLCMHAK